ncbi:MAG: sulfite exporter TauE/SafE family protein [Candidatus Jordarchaeales archaeon]
MLGELSGCCGMDWLSSVASVAIGFCSGCLTGLMGASGVLIVVPALTMVLGLPIHAAIGTSLAVDVIASLIVTYVYYRRGNVDLKSGVWLALGAVLGAQAGSVLAAHIPELELGGGFGVFLMISGVGLWREDVRRKLRLFSGASVVHGVETVGGVSKVGLKQAAASFIIGFLIGVISGVFGAGGGVMFLLVLIFLLKYPVHKAVGTSTLIMAVTAFSGTLGYALNGNVAFLAAFVVGAGTVVGGRIGAVYANRAPEEKLAKIIGAIFALLGVIMIVEQLV